MTNKTALKISMLQLRAIQIEMEEYMRGEHLKTMPERLTLLTYQIGDICRCHTHDPKNNPKTRPHIVGQGAGIIQAEKTAHYGDAFMMLTTMAIADGVDITDAVSIGLQRIRDREYMANEYRLRDGGH